MKIVHLCSDFDKFHVGLSDSLMERGVNSVILAYQLRRGSFKAIDAKSNIIKVNSNVRFRRTPLFHSSRLNSAYGNICEYLDHDCDIVHAHMLFTDGILAYKIKQHHKKKYVVAVRSSDVNYGLLWSMPWLRKQAIDALCDAERIVFVSPAFKDYLILRIGEKYRGMVEGKSIVLPNGVDSFWHENRLNRGKTAPKPTDEISIVCVGDICSNKSQLRLAEYVKKMNVMLDRRFSLVIAGSVFGEKILSTLKQYDFVRYHGLLNKEQLVALYAKSDIFALISIRETFGLVYPEAMTQGLPIVYTKGQGIDGYFPAGDVGYPISPFSYDEFKDSILKILRDYENVSEHCVLRSAVFSWENIAGVYEEIYLEIEND